MSSYVSSSKFKIELDPKVTDPTRVALKSTIFSYYFHIMNISFESFVMYPSIIFYVIFYFGFTFYKIFKILLTDFKRRKKVKNKLFLLPPI